MRMLAGSYLITGSALLAFFLRFFLLEFFVKNGDVLLGVKNKLRVECLIVASARMALNLLMKK